MSVLQFRVVVSIVNLRPSPYRSIRKSNRFGFANLDVCATLALSMTSIIAHTNGSWAHGNSNTSARMLQANCLLYPGHLFERILIDRRNLLEALIFGNGVLLAIKGIYDSQEGANHENDSESQESYWLAEARTGVRRAARTLDPGNMPGDIIPKGAYFLKIKYYVLHSVGSLKYIEAAMPEAVVDFRNVISCPRLHWDKVFRAQGILGKVYQLHPRTHGIIGHLVPLHGLL